ncbi:hypothetical protein ACWENQ_40920 [Nonomuraea sp. NPDC004354]
METYIPSLGWNRRRYLALDEARNFYGPTLDHTGVHVLSTHVVSDPDAERHGSYRATIVFRQVTD